MAGRWEPKKFAQLGALVGVLSGLGTALGQPGSDPESIARKAGMVVGYAILSVAGFVLVAAIRNYFVRTFPGRTR